MTAVSSADLLLDWHRQRTALREPGLSISRVGGCDRQVGYILAGTDPSDDGHSIQGAIGTAIHAAIEEEANRRGISAERHVVIGGIPGHYDRLEGDELIDTKTVYNRIGRVKRDGPPRRETWQVNLLAGGLIAAGTPVRWVRIDYLDRANGEEYTWRGRPDPTVIREALAWVKNIREAPLDMLPRVFLPDSAACSHCPFRSTCWGQGVAGRRPESVAYLDHPDAQHWAAEFEVAKAEEKDAERRKKLAAGALDALRPGPEGQTVRASVGGVALRWTWYRGREGLDEDEVTAFYAKHGERPPYKRGKGYYVLTTAEDDDE